MRHACLVPLIVLLVLSGCVARPVPAPPDQERTYALADPASTRLGRMLAPHLARHDGRSGFSLIETGPEALSSLRAFIALAEKTLDLQYYIWRNDETGRRLLASLLAAADRGVRVRLLLDDMEKDWSDHEFARLSAHPNFEVRLFNPFSRSGGRFLDILLDFRRITHRMHNKLFVADNALAIVGGRNVGDRYFSMEQAAHFRDLDLHAAGPIARKLSESFDEFWNSRWSITAGDLRDGRHARPEMPGTEKALAKRVAAQADKPPDEGRNFRPAAYAADVFSGLVWTGAAAVVADSPEKPRTGNPELARALAAHLAGERLQALLIETAFLIPGEAGVARLCDLVDAGVQVRALTNSLSSTDSIAAYSGYKKFRRAMLRCGVELYELRPRGTPDRGWRWSADTSAAILHSKAAVIDRRWVFIGSFNFDLRSVYINTEIGLLLHSPQIAAATARFIEAGMSPRNAYRLRLEDGEIVWRTWKDGALVRLADEPGNSLWQRLVSGFIGLLPIEGQL